MPGLLSTISGRLVTSVQASELPNNPGCTGLFLPSASIAEFLVVGWRDVALLHANQAIGRFGAFLLATGALEHPADDGGGKPLEAPPVVFANTRQAVGQAEDFVALAVQRDVDGVAVEPEVPPPVPASPINHFVIYRVPIDQRKASTEAVRDRDLGLRDGHLEVLANGT